MSALVSVNGEPEVVINETGDLYQLAQRWADRYSSPEGTQLRLRFYTNHPTHVFMVNDIGSAEYQGSIEEDEPS